MNLAADPLTYSLCEDRLTQDRHSGSVGGHPLAAVTASLYPWYEIRMG
jgi:hypothetical protein